jgi:hypothetical protein
VNVKESSQEEHSKKGNGEPADMVKRSRTSQICRRPAISLSVVESICGTDLLNEPSGDQRGAQLQAVFDPISFTAGNEIDKLTGHGIEEQGFEPFILDSGKHGSKERQIVEHAPFNGVCSSSDLLGFSITKHLDELLVRLDGFVFD